MTSGWKKINRRNQRRGRRRRKSLIKRNINRGNEFNLKLSVFIESLSLRKIKTNVEV